MGLGRHQRRSQPISFFHVELLVRMPDVPLALGHRTLIDVSQFLNQRRAHRDLSVANLDTSTTPISDKRSELLPTATFGRRSLNRTKLMSPKCRCETLFVSKQSQGPKIVTAATDKTCASCHATSIPNLFVQLYVILKANVSIIQGGRFRKCWSRSVGMQNSRMQLPAVACSCAKSDIYYYRD